MGHAAERVHSDEFRRIISHFMSGVTVITTRENDINHGMTVSAVCSLSLEPPMIVACLHKESPTQQAIGRTGRFAVNVLAQDQQRLAYNFAKPKEDKFSEVGYRLGILGQPVIHGGLASLECRVQKSVEAATHQVIFGEVINASVSDGRPLAYFQGRFGRLEIAEDLSTLERLRYMVFERVIALDEELNVHALAEQLNTNVESIDYALTRLTGEGLVIRIEGRGYYQKPLGPSDADEAYDAKKAIDLGVLELVCGSLSAAQVEELRVLANNCYPALHEDGSIKDIEAHLKSNDEFHLAFISLSGSKSLIDAYRGLRLPGLTVRGSPSDKQIAIDLAKDHEKLIDAIATNNKPIAKNIIIEHNERGRLAVQQAVKEAGGQI